MATRLFMLAGEASGDILGGVIISALKNPPSPKNMSGASYTITGVGGALMQAEGLEVLFDMEELTVLGIWGAIAAYARLKTRANELIAHIIATKPDAIITIDSKGFSLRFAKALKKAMAKAGWSAPIIHLVAPTVWAWAGWRAKPLAKSIDHLLCLFPFEVPYFTKHGVNAVAVGHPSLDTERQDKNTARKALNLNQDSRIIALLPGSRKREVASLLPKMLEAADLLHTADPSMRFLLPMASPVASQITTMVASRAFVQTMPQAQIAEVMAASDFGLMCSGTITLEAALSGLNGCVYYCVDMLTTIIGRMLLDRSKVVLANAITGEAIYRFYANNEVTTKGMVEVVKTHFIAQETAIDIKPRLIKEMKIEGGKGFGQNVANAIRDAINAC